MSIYSGKNASLLSVIKQVPMFSGICDDVVRSCLDASVVKKFAKGSAIFWSEDVADHLYIVISGWVKLYRLSPEGGESVISVIAKEESFAEAAVFGRGRMPVNAQAISDVEMLMIPKSFFVQKIKQDADFAFRIMEGVSKRQRELMQQVEQLSARSASQRVGGFLYKLCSCDCGECTVLLPYDKSLISSRLAIKPETFSRVFKKLQKDLGIVESKGKVFIPDVSKLSDYCEM